MELQEKIQILSGAAKYDVSCASCGVSRFAAQGLGSTVSAGICHSWSDDGRCVSLLKVLLTNYCIYDCAYCVNRRSNDVPRAAFTPEELIDLTIQFYKRNYIEGLFLSSGVVQSPDHTMERLICVAQTLRERRHYHGYIHLKVIPGSSA
ncbi:radical SAM protein, partial [Candidatus Termititenax persephonae]